MTTSWACSIAWAAPSAFSCFTAFCSPPAAFACTWPNAPNSTFANERFMARHMMIDRIRPDDPSRAPAITSSLLSSTNPMATAERPAYEFSSEMTVGMSAPPIGMISSTPNSSESTMITGNRKDSCSGRKMSAMPHTTAIARRPRFDAFWNG